MSDFDDTTGMQNPVFRMMSSQSTNTNSVQSMNPINQIGMNNSNNNMNFPMLNNSITEQEIQKHKNKLNNLINKLINIHDVDEEISTDNEIKNETEFLLSLLNIKKTEMKRQSNMINNMNNNNLFNINNNNFNMSNMMDNNQMQQQIMQQQMMQQQILAQQQQAMFQQMMAQQMMQQTAHQQNHIYVNFRKTGACGQGSASIMIHCLLDEKVSSIIEKYRNACNDRDTNIKFIFHALPLNPSLTLSEAGITNNENIFIVRTDGVKG